MRRLIVGTNSTNEKYNADCDLGVVEVSPGLFRSLNERAALVLELAHKAPVYEVYFFGSPCQFVKAIGCDELAGIGGIEDVLESGAFMELPESFSFPTDADQRTECGQTILRVERTGPDGQTLKIKVAFIAIPKHTSIYITTEAIALEELHP